MGASSSLVMEPMLGSLMFVLYDFDMSLCKFSLEDGDDKTLVSVSVNKPFWPGLLHLRLDRPTAHH